MLVGLGVGRQESIVRIQESGDYFYLFSPHPTPHTPHPTPHTPIYENRNLKIGFNRLLSSTSGVISARSCNYCRHGSCLCG
ncbi:MAG: hypothetical protein EWV41_17400 [Microcystis wesenbergii Mw_MB_S_20031200_S109]|uniref:Uncharacterized protein n=1 Tax=Microcystis wesenbergii Mw_MB_S_20031200_S109D TaxID=2486241 RepID=A0A552LQ04_9CHRO|nr:MAG: hypothetical protein EWV41_17400 [Microcystis wesenbergii Mw_MB_S_20031200_S109]TRV22291.1 MAG: hypothetical protein EWV88_13850 [Microcystis wesenbergii Mw_MB_S_20031200_S109D]